MLPVLNNRYFGLRHGQSQANTEGIVVSSPEIGKSGYGLTEIGREQVEIATRHCAALNDSTVIVCSDFKRAVETAEIARSILGCAMSTHDMRLRERYFGAWDMKPDTSYQTVWDKDVLDPGQSIGNVESVARVCERIMDLIESIESHYAGETLLLVSHGDPLHLTQTVFEGRSPTEHRDIEHWNTAEIRELVPNHLS